MNDRPALLKCISPFKSDIGLITRAPSLLSWTAYVKRRVLTTDTFIRVLVLQIGLGCVGLSVRVRNDIFDLIRKVSQRERDLLFLTGPYRRVTTLYLAQREYSIG